MPRDALSARGERRICSQLDPERCSNMSAQCGSIATLALASLSFVSQCGCGGGGGSSTGPPPNPPTIAAISPNSSEQDGPAFTLSVVGSNFLSSATVQWNGSGM